MPFTLQPLDDLRPGLFSAVGVLHGFELVRERRIRDDQRVEGLVTTLHPGVLELLAQAPNARLVRALLRGRARRDTIHLRQEGVVDFGVAGLLFILEHALANDPWGRWDAEDLEVALFARPERTTVTVRALVRQADEDRSVAVGQDLPVGVVKLREDVRCPVVPQVDERVALSR